MARVLCHKQTRDVFFPSPLCEYSGNRLSPPPSDKLTFFTLNSLVRSPYFFYSEQFGPSPVLYLLPGVSDSDREATNCRSISTVVYLSMFRMSIHPEFRCLLVGSPRVNANGFSGT